LTRNHAPIIVGNFIYML